MGWEVAIVILLPGGSRYSGACRNFLDVTCIGVSYQLSFEDDNARVRHIKS